METERRDIGSVIADEYRVLLRYAARLIPDVADYDVEDIVQDVMLRIFSLPVSRVPMEKLAAYLRKAVKNRVVDLHRSGRPAESLDSPLSHEGGCLSDLLADTGRDTESEAQHRELCEALYSAIDQLPKAERDIVIATEFHGRKFAELSSEWRIPIGTLLSRKSRAIARIRRMLSKYDGMEG